MANRQGQESTSGFSLVETTLAIMLAVLLLSGLTQFLLNSFRANTTLKERAFAYTKAQALIAEIQALAEKRRSQGIEDVTDLDDKGIKRPTLTITRDSTGALVAPDHPLSDNVRVMVKGAGEATGAEKWLWSRVVRLSGLGGVSNRELRLLNVRIFRKDKNGVDRLVADVSSVVSAVASVYPSTQVFDIFLIELESIPGWWVMKESIRSFASAMVNELEAQNPGLDFRVHWISRSSYGRNPVYRPRTNLTADSLQPSTDVYYYPGLMPSGNASSFYYPPENFRARISIDGNEANGYHADTNPYPYAIADYYNHAMRYPREKALQEARIRAVRDRKQAIRQARANMTQEPDPLVDMSEAPTLRLFLEDLNSNPEKYRNALIMNLHGEMLPFPPLRNYSDPAKAPDKLPGVRVVTHPEELRTHRDATGATTDDVKLRVYAYLSEPAKYAGTAAMPDTHPILLQVMDVDLTDGAGGLHTGVAIESLSGGRHATDTYTALGPASDTGSVAPSSGDMCYEASFVDPGTGKRKFTLIRLYNTPVICTAVGGQGLAATTRARLYGLEYVPSCTADTDFSTNLASTGSGPKNTARWVITVPKNVFSDARFVKQDSTYYDPQDDVVLTVRTRIMDPALSDPFTTGQMHPTPVQPENFSETYTWWATSRDAVPFTERFQFQGDPRHNPYKDLLHGDPDFPNGYNWHHDAMATGAGDYVGIDPLLLRSGWMGRIQQDMPRAHELVRRGLVESKCIFSTLNGWSFYYFGIGNEIGADASNGYPDSIPVELTAWGSPGTSGFANNITGTRSLVRSAATTPMWWGIPWLGELYPDSAYSTDWFATDINGNIRGNLSAGTGATQYYREAMDVVYANAASPYPAYGTTLVALNQRAKAESCAGFFNMGTTASHYNHFGTNVTAPWTQAGCDLSVCYGLELPPTVQIKRPFTLTSGGGVSPEFSLDPYASDRYTGAFGTVFYYDDASGKGCGIVELTNPAGTSTGFFLMNGMAESVTLGPNLLTKFSSTAILHSYFEIATTNHPSRPKILPRVEISSPTIVSEISDPTTLEIKFDISWKRWDGQKYTSTTSDTFFEDESDLRYVIMYSLDGGLVWRHVQDDSLATPGEMPDVVYQEPDWNSGAAEGYTLPTPTSKFPAGSYRIRVEVHRVGQSMHYSQHQVQCYINR